MTKIPNTLGSNRFSIEAAYSPTPQRDDSPNAETFGKITIGEFSETFRMSLSFWNVEDYRTSWRTALSLLLERSDSISCLVSSITDPRDSNFIFCWPLYREGETVHVHNSIIFLEELSEEFEPVAPWKSILPRSVMNDEGQQISEWATTTAEIGAFLDCQFR